MKALFPLFAALLFLPTALAQVTSADLVGKPLPKLGSLEFFAEEANLAGKPAIVEFWATWCPPCRDSIPHLNEIYETYGSKGLQVLGITDEPKQTIRAFVKKIPIDYPVATAPEELATKFGVEGIPHAFLVNKEGVIVWEGHPMELTNKIIEKVL